MRVKQTLAVIFVLALLAGGIAVSTALEYLEQPMLTDGEAVTFELSTGRSFRSAVSELHEQGILRWPRVLALYARLTGAARHVHAGEYRIEPGLTPLGLLSRMTEGKVVQRSVTLVEGSRVSEAIQRLQAAPGIVVTEGLTATVLAGLLGVEDSGVEGLLFPDTYLYPRGMRDVDLLRAAYQRMRSILAEEWELRATGLPYDNAYEALIMASIVEKETGVPEERGEIAGVFVRRLKRGMKLQTDPTVIYGIGPDFDGNLRSRHLRDAANPYNTYRHKGLPPTPIALAGREAIYAALHPADGDSLYFVAKGDGSHYFSQTLAEHTAAVRKYQIEKRRKDYRSSPQ